jgi:ketosteroid isomerase-like protein
MTAATTVPTITTDQETRTMKSILALAASALLIAAPASAQTTPRADAHAHHAPADAPAIDVPVAAQPAVEVVERFGKALANADFATVEELLAEDVLILETGGAERSRAEYLGHHAKADARFLAGAQSTLVRRRARIDADLAWVGSESELRTQKDGKPATQASTETMVLRNTPQGWRIVHIHWSSRPKKSS